MDWFDWDAYIKNMEPPKPDSPQTTALAKANKTGLKPIPKNPRGQTPK